MQVWEHIDEVNTRLKLKDIWSANTLFLINVIGAFLFDNDKHFEQVIKRIFERIHMHVLFGSLKQTITQLH